MPSELKRHIAGRLLAATIILLLGPTISYSQDYYLFFGSQLGRTQATFSYRADYYPTVDVDDQDADHSLVEHRADLTLPLISSDTSELNFSAGFGARQMDGSAVLPDSGRALPDNLYSPQFGLNFRRKLDSGIIVGVAADVSSPSDEPFAGYDEIGFGATLFLRKPVAARPNDAWLFMINYSNNRTDLNNIPLPLIAYWHQPSPRFTALIGVPLALNWRPVDWMALNFFYAPIRSVRAGVSFRIAGPVWIFAQYAYRNQKYFLADRADSSDRLYYYEQRLSGGIRARLGRNVSLRISGGYAYDRYYFQGEDFDDRGKDRIDLESGPFVSATISLMF